MSPRVWVGRGEGTPPGSQGSRPQQGRAWAGRKGSRPVVSLGWGLRQPLGWAASGPGPGARLSAPSSWSPGTGRGAGTAVLHWPCVSASLAAGVRAEAVGGGLQAPPGQRRPGSSSSLPRPSLGRSVLTYRMGLQAQDCCLHTVGAKCCLLAGRKGLAPQCLGPAGAPHPRPIDGEAAAKGPVLAHP